MTELTITARFPFLARFLHALQTSEMVTDRSALGKALNQQQTYAHLA